MRRNRTSQLTRTHGIQTFTPPASGAACVAGPARRALLRGGLLGGAALGVSGALALVGGAGAAAASKPEDLFKGQIVILKKRLASRYATAGAFIDAIKANKTDKVWPKEQKGNDHAIWRIEYIAFFAQPLSDYEIDLKFYDVTGGARRFVAGDAQMTRDRDSRIFASDIEVAKPEFNVNRQYMMTIEKRGRVIARTSFWLRGEAESYSGRVEFSEEEVSGRKR